jgi:ribonuclease-3
MTPYGNHLGDDREVILQAFEQSLGIRFRDRTFLNLAFFHRSSLPEQGLPGTGSSNERLEFLGDSILGMLIAEYLYHSFPDRPEGDLAKIKSYVVSEDSLSRLALDWKLDRCLVLGKGEENSGGRQKKAILADAIEALIGAWYLDAGLEATRQLVIEHWSGLVAEVIENRHRKDYKTLLQEYCQKELKVTPRYQCIQKSGPDHAKIFVMEVRIGEQSYGSAKGSNKKEAEQGAAELAWQKLQQN